MARFSLRLAVQALSLLPFFLSAVTANPCYTVDGREKDNYVGLQPCNSDAVSMCCGLNRTADAGMGKAGESSKDVCLPNGLCLNQDKDTSGTIMTTYWRNLCSDPTWPAESCLRVCERGSIMGDGTTDSSTTYPMTPCESNYNTTRWCCGKSNTDCCARWGTHEDSVTIPSVLGDGDVVSHTSSFTTGPTSSPTSKGSSTSTSGAAVSNPTSSGSTLPESGTGSGGGGTNNKLVAAVAAPIGAVLVAVIGVALYLFLAKRRQAAAMKEQMEYGGYPSVHPYYARQPPVVMHELSAGPPIVEADNHYRMGGK